MILIAHIIIALAGVAYATYLYFSPTPSKFRVSYALTAATIGSGTWLVIADPAHMVHSCIMGLAYLGIVLTGIILARNKLAAEQQKANKD